MIKIDNSEILFDVTDDYSYLFETISMSIVGGVTFGAYGVLSGLGASVLDEALIYSGCIEKKTISYAFVGFTFGYNIYPHKSFGLIGLASSILITQDALTDHFSYLSNIIINAVLGFKTMSLPGSITGAMFSVIDQIFEQNNITNKFYLSHSFFGAVISSVIFGRSICSAAIGGLLGLIIADIYIPNYSSVSLIEISNDLYHIYLKIIPQVQLDDYIKNYTFIFLCTQISINQLRVILLKHQQNIIYSFEHMDNLNNANYKLTVATIKFSVFLLPYLCMEYAIDTLNSFFSTKIYVIIDDSLIKILFYNETALKMSYAESSTVLIDNLRLDSKIISKDGTKFVIDYITKFFNGIYGMGVLIDNVPEILIYLMVYSKAKEYISYALAELQDKYELQIKEQESIISTIYKHDMTNIKIISETGGALYSYKQLKNAHEDLRKNALIKDQLGAMMNTWRLFESIVNFISTYYLIGYKVGAGIIDFNSRIKMHNSCLQASSFLDWNSQKSQEIKTLYQSIKRLNIFLNESTDNTSSKIKNIDNIKREQSIYNDRLIIKNMNVIVANKKLIYVNYLELGMGNRYVLSGPSGSGKSSLITKIIGVINNNIGGEGIVYYPKDCKIILINQQIYLPLNKKMEEIIFYPEDVNQEKIPLVQHLLTRFSLTHYKLNQVEDWYSALSGGQKQQIRIISAIIKEPKVLILDEVFNGLDKESIELMQAIIVETLSETLIISIDHNVLENNRTSFYTHSLEILERELINTNDKEKYHNEYENFCSFNEIIGDDQKCYDYVYGLIE